MVGLLRFRMHCRVTNNSIVESRIPYFCGHLFYVNELFRVECIKQP